MSAMKDVCKLSFFAKEEEKICERTRIASKCYTFELVKMNCQKSNLQQRVETVEQLPGSCW
jgi:hypothetical protein